ncbi:MAG: carbohydrate kinase family protein, partial [Ignavibacteria bacterium]|nr:carbohydrate kinase family protein [Ignavibacteria bacterium]
LIRISHINRFKNSSNINLPSDITKRIIDKYKDKKKYKTNIMINLGSSQIISGLDYWEKSMQDCDVVQFNLHEAKRLFSVNQTVTPPNLLSIIHWLQEKKITALITLSKFGAIGSYKDGKDGLIFAWPIETNDFIDPTGAGDAFSAGMASILCEKPSFSFADFFQAINIGKFWATYACTKIGGCGDCPTMDTINDFITITSQQSPTEVHNETNLLQTLRLLEKALT